MENDTEGEASHSLEESPFNLELPDLSELPLEDFVNIESFMNDLDGVVTNNELDSVVTEVFPSEDIIQEYVLGDFSVQSSPSVDCSVESEYKELLDSVSDSNFLKEFMLETSNNCDEVFQDDIKKEVSNFSDIDELLSALGCTYGMEAEDVSLAKPDTSIIDITSNSVVTCGTKRSHEPDLTSTAKKLKVDDIDNVELALPGENEKDVIRRIKNNEASRVTRAKRKVKHGKLFEKEAELEKSNTQLRIKIEVMQKEADVLREVLLAKLSESAK